MSWVPFVSRLRDKLNQVNESVHQMKFSVGEFVKEGKFPEKKIADPLNNIDLNDINLISRQEMDWIVRKMQFLEVESSGSCDGGRFAYIRLKNGMVFYSFPTAEWQRKIFQERRKNFPSNLSEEALNVAFDIVTRFIRENIGMWIPTLTYHVSMLGPDCALIDVGAYIGYGAMRVATLSSEGGRILCLEAEGQSVEIMQRMIEENKLGHRMKAVHCALGDKEGQMKLHVDKAEGNRQGNIVLNAMTDEVSGVEYDMSRYVQETIPRRKLDTLLPELHWIHEDAPFMMHLGINGAELAALHGAIETLQNRRRFGVKVSTRYFDPAEGPIHEKVKNLLGGLDNTTVLDIEPHVYAYRWG